MRASTAGWLLALSLGGACDGPSLSEEAGLEFEACRVPGGARARCTTVTVPEDPEHPDVRSLTLQIAVAPAAEPEGKAPVMLIAGGPGQGAAAAYGPALGMFSEVNRHHDIILLDQRGTGGSNPLRCPRSDTLDLDEALSVDVDAERLETCKAGLDADLTKYTTGYAVQDMAVVLDALGHSSAHLVGGSYGTRVALAFARAHPQRVRTLVLDGVAPVDFAMPLSFAKDAQSALDAMVRDCEQRPACAAAFGDLAAQTASLLASEAVVTTTVKHPRTSAPVELELSAEQLASGLRGMLYAPDLASLLPLSISQAAEGNLDPLVAQSVLLGDSMSSTVADGMFMSVVCAEDVPFITDAEARAQTKGTFLGMSSIDNLRAACASWPRGTLEPGYREPVVSDVPTLVLSGALDPVTPPRWGEHALQTLSAGRHVIVPGAGHGITTLPCADRVLTSFFESEDATAVDAACLEARQRPAFFVDFAGPAVNP